ncbi:tRNA pseudouridine(65) synthase TruC [Shewanella dokdonensis]|nr:tRNA pseudouridine(65) synthase TruC [Shewanella dokdonensis]MCL1073590.1 tRNA pseudouridine(65) synthase TruC [Shewanella dokdonensis]
MSCSVVNDVPLVEETAPQIQVLFEDEHLVAIHKPAGLLVHKTYLARHEKYFAMQMTRDLVGCHVYPVHRLDRPTSGVLLFAKSSAVAHQLCVQFESRQVRKYYLALVRGNMLEAGLLDYPLKEELDDVADKMASQPRQAQSAITRYEPLLNAEIPVPSGRYQTSRFALLRLQPLTGRKHQLRRHMDHLRHPIIGDTAHGDGKQNRFFREHFGVNRMWLLAQKLSLTHPVTGAELSVVTEPEAEWQQIFTALGWGDDELCSGKPWTLAGT